MYPAKNWPSFSVPWWRAGSVPCSICYATLPDNAIVICNLIRDGRYIHDFIRCATPPSICRRSCWGIGLFSPGNEALALTPRKKMEVVLRISGITDYQGILLHHFFKSFGITTQRSMTGFLPLTAKWNCRKTIVQLDLVSSPGLPTRVSEVSFTDHQASCESASNSCIFPKSQRMQVS